MTDTATAPHASGSTPADQRRTRWRFLVGQGALTDSSAIRLFPVAIAGMNDSFVVTRSDTGSTIETSDAGVTCIQLLQRGAVGTARRALAEKYGCAESEVDIVPLLDCLVAADFIDSVDGYPLSTNPGHNRDARTAALITPLWAPIVSTAARMLPLQLSLPLAHQRLTRRDTRMLELISRHVRAFPGVAHDEATARAIARANLDALAANYLDRLLITLLPSEKLHSWFTRFISVTGLEHIDRARTDGRGVLLCAFHTGSYTLLTFALGARGYAHTFLSGLGDTGQGSIENRLAESRANGYDYPITLIDSPNPARPMMRALQRGGIVLMLLDSGLQPQDSSLEIDFLGHRLRAAKGAAWLAERTGAVLLPTVMLQRGRSRHAMEISPIPAPTGTDAEDRVRSSTAALYRTLEGHVSREPAQWLKWKDLPALA